MDNSRLFLYAALAFVGLLIWEQWKADYGPQPEPLTQQQVQATANNAGDGAANGQVDNAKMQNDLPQLDNAPPSAANGSVGGQLVTVETDVVRATISTQGGVITSLKLKKYPVSVEQKDVALELLFNKQDELYVVQSGLQSSGSPAPTHYSDFTTDQNTYRLGEGLDQLEVPFYWNENGVKVTKTYVFTRGDYLINVSHRIDNGSSNTWLGSQYRQLQRSRPLETSNFLYTYTGAVVYNDEIKYEKVDFDDMESENLKLESSGGWTAMLQHYFISAWVPAEDEKNLVYSIANTRRYPATYTIGMRSPSMQIENGASAEFSSQLYVGPKMVERLEEIAPGLELTVDYGALTFISYPLYVLLSIFHDWVGNWGVAIILLTLLVKAVFFKLSEKSYKSMARMRKVAPRLKTLKERYGDDRQKMNQAMMELYKTEKINPLGGCLPVLVQMPVFIALYWALLESVELRHAPFLFWIQDLSTKDPYFVLPVIMGISMLIQQKLNPAPPDPVQEKVMMILPLVFTVFFAFFPSGLVLYWVSNNVLSIAQQYVITKRIESGEEK